MKGQSQKPPMGLYELEFKYIPFLLDQCARGEVDATCLIDVEKFRKLLENEGIEVTWKWEYFSVTRKKVGETLMLIYTLPRPIRPPHAKYSAIMTTKKGIEYFLLESDYENGDITAGTLVNVSPFSEYDWYAIFGQNLVSVRDYVNNLHNIIIPASSRIIA